jgi:hypothetical protein
MEAMACGDVCKRPAERGPRLQVVGDCEATLKTLRPMQINN